jgi:hypothetical protein
MGRMRFWAAAVAAVAMTLGLAGTASASRYIVVFKNGHSGAGIAAVHRAGGKIVRNSRVGVATVSAHTPAFARTLRASGAVVAVAPNASFQQVTSMRPSRVARVQPSTRWPPRGQRVRRCTRLCSLALTP